MTRHKPKIAAVLLSTLMGVSLLVPVAAQASESGRRNTTIALGAATAYFISQKQWVPAAIAGAGTAVAYKNWDDAIKARHRNDRYLNYQFGYNDNNYSYNNANVNRHNGQYGHYDRYNNWIPDVRYNQNNGGYGQNYAHGDRDDQYYAHGDRDDQYSRGDRDDRFDGRDRDDRLNRRDRDDRGRHYNNRNHDRDDFRRRDRDHDGD